MTIAVLVCGSCLFLLYTPAGQPAVFRLKQPLETRFPRPCLKANEDITGIVVLGGLASRTHEAVRLAALYPRAKLVLTGTDHADEAIVHFSGLSSDRTTFERNAINTFENALFAKRMANPRASERWLLVTSKIHMPRALGTFSAAGFPVEAWGTDDAQSESPYIVKSVMHEVFGLLIYRMLGRTNTLFPAPISSRTLEVLAVPERGQASQSASC